MTNFAPRKGKTNESTIYMCEYQMLQRYLGMSQFSLQTQLF